MSTMPALVKRYAEPGLSLEALPRPKVADDDVLIAVERTGICGTDLHIYQWDEWARQTVPIPMIIGHEFVGQIIEIGSGVRDFEPGMIVSAEGHVVCGRCRNCMAGRRHLCADAKGIGVHRSGAFAQYIAVPQANVWEHDAAIDRDVAAIFDPLGNAVHTALQFDLVGEDVLITGAGPIGMMAVAIARHVGARHIVITDINPKRLAMATSLGATRTVDVRHEKLSDVKRELGIREGFDVGLEMSGSTDAFADMVTHMCHGGSIALLGIPPKQASIDWHAVVFNMITIKGIYGRQIFETWYKMSVLIQSGLDIKPVITHRLPFDRFEEGFQAMLDGEAGKVVLDWQQ